MHKEKTQGLHSEIVMIPFCFLLCDHSSVVFITGIDYKTTTILLDGRRVKLELWDTSGQGRFCTIFRSYSRGAQGILLVYDITNRWSFDGIDRWIKEIDEHAPGVPRILVGNRLHLAFKRQVPTEQARSYAEKNCMTFFEVSPLCNFNVIESFTELSRIVLMRHGMEKIWRPNRGELSWPGSQGCCMSFGLCGHVPEVFSPDVSPTSMAGILRGCEVWRN
uniref:small monomeric GTPase n=1 Tax=Anolis carolinensis TaxID=28377 RepID=H9G718_ANOCA